MGLFLLIVAFALAILAEWESMTYRN